MRLVTTLRWVVALAIVSGAASAMAEDMLKLAIGQRGNWENAAPELGQKQGFFRKHGLTLELLYTQGAGETLQAVISGSVDIGVGVGTAGVLGAYAKGAPEVRDQFYPKDNLRLDRLSGLDAAMADAVSLKFLAAPITRQQQDELFKYYARGAK